jgi:Na+-transporting NADH:ubiquinone oxidoreductase subunit NqrC
VVNCLSSLVFALLFSLTCGVALSAVKYFLKQGM